MRLKRLIKEFEFLEENRQRITLNTGARLHPVLQHLQLMEDSADEYPTDDGINAVTWVSNPASAKQWLGFQCDAMHVRNEAGVIVTSVAFRLSDGTNQFWWNGAAWEANTSDWNAEEEVAANIQSFDATEKKIGVIINLKTTDKRFTPTVKRVKVLFSSDVEFMEDLIYRSLVPALRDGVRPISDYLVQLAEDSDEIDLKNDYPLETLYNVVGIDSVFDHDSDPQHNNDLFDSFDEVTQVITMSQELTANTKVFIKFIYEPVVAVATSEDYVEVGKEPSLIIDSLMQSQMTQRSVDDAVINKSNTSAVVVQAPMQGNIECSMILATDKGVDQRRLQDEVTRFFAETPFIRSRALDEQYRLWLFEEPQGYEGGNQPDSQASRLRFRITGALFWHRVSTDGFHVQRLNLTTSAT